LRFRADAPIANGRCIWKWDGAMNYRLADPNARPLMFSPDVDWSHFEEPNIIHAY